MAECSNDPEEVLYFTTTGNLEMLSKYNMDWELW
jgi:hypothetical protein